MSDYTISQVYPSDSRTIAQIDELLDREGIKRDKNLDYTCVMYDEDYQVIGTGSCFGNTLRCFAVSSDHQGEGLLNEIISHLIDYQYNCGNMHLFLYTKIKSSQFFRDLGFYEIARVSDTLVFMENRKTGFADYLRKIQKETEHKQLSERKTDISKRVGAIVMNANPFTYGHQYLVERASAECDLLHIFVVSEDVSLIPFSVRKKLIEEGTAHLDNIVLHESGPYMISNATFPSYFLKDETEVIKGHAHLDIAIFTNIAKTLGIDVRYVGEENTSHVTGIYNQIMKENLGKNGLECCVIPRKKVLEKEISASDVRKAIQKNDMERLKDLVPVTTYEFFLSSESENIKRKIRDTMDVVHY